jgi:type I restriction enzyme S subunit
MVDQERASTKPENGSAVRNTILLSHANPEDNEFTLWLASQLAHQDRRSRLKKQGHKEGGFSECEGAALALPGFNAFAPEWLRQKFLFYFLLSQRKAFIEKGQRGAQPNISQEIVRSHPMLLPPIAEQNRIVDMLEALLEKVQASRERIDTIPGILKHFRQSVLAAACSGRLTADWREQSDSGSRIVASPANPKAASAVEELYDTPEYWHWLPLNALCDPSRAICYGVIKLGTEHNNGVPCLRTSDVKPLRIDTVGVKRIAPAISNNFSRTVLRGGEVLVNVRGTLGGVAVVPQELRAWNISRKVAMVPLMGILPEYVAYWIASLPCQNWLTGVAKGVAYTGINIEDLRELPVAVPSIAEQQEIVRRVHELFAIADRIEVRRAQATAYLQKLPQSILAKAFQGELVPTEAELARREGREF